MQASYSDRTEIQHNILANMTRLLLHAYYRTIRIALGNRLQSNIVYVDKYITIPQHSKIYPCKSNYINMDRVFNMLLGIKEVIYCYGV